MPEFQSVQGGVIRTVGSTSGASSLATLITANASANVKGTYVELTAATEFDSHWAFVQMQDASNGTSYLVDIGIGAATEQVIIPDLYMRSRAAGHNGSPYLFPVFIPKGSRITARCQASTGGTTIKVAVTLISGTLLAGMSGSCQVSGYGAVTTSQGTNVDPGAVANTDSAWVEITAATDRDHRWLCVGARWGDQGITAAMQWRLNIGIGAATEAVLVPDLHVTADITMDDPSNTVLCFPCFVPKGSRLTAKARCSVTTDADRDLFVKIYGAG